MIIYISGPMRGFPFYNFPAFDRARDRIIDLGHTPISPADMDRAVGFEPASVKAFLEFDMGAAIERDIEAIKTCDAIMMLEHWEDSVGAKAEHALAVWMGKTVYGTIADVIPSDRDGSLDYMVEVRRNLGPRPMEATAGSLTEYPSEVPKSEIKNGEYIVRDSGTRQVFETGAQRDSGDHKGMFHLIPYEPLERLAQLYEAGALKYGRNNWRKGIPLSRFVDSAMRHLHKLSDGWDDEDHATAVLWNLCGYVWTELRVKSGKLPKTLLDMPHNEEA